MNIQWQGSDEYYRVQLAEDFDKKDAIRQLILKILDLAAGKENWNLVVLDKWIFNLGRLIGHIQNDDQAIGMDRGYRVGVQFLAYYDRLETSPDDRYDQVLETINEELENLILDVLQDESFKVQLQKYHDQNPFTLEISEQGQRIGLRLNVV
ncbi:MAG: hypothetical protein AAF206_25115 [Bacteroidota bacterium]